MRNYFHPHYYATLRSIISYVYFTNVNYIRAFIWKIKLGKGNKFRGITLFRLIPKSKIIIGDKSIFNSSLRSNLIGVYTQCIFSTLKEGALIEIGDSCGFSGTVIGCAVHIKIGNNVRCGANTLITDTDWHFDDYRTGEDKAIFIDDNVWLGYGVKVLKGVSIGKNTIVGACSVVVKDLPADVVAVGNPCKVIKTLS